MGKKYDFDYIIIGSGPAGSTAALSLAKSKKSIAIVDGRAFGGANINTRDIPYGVSLGFSHTLSRLSTYPEIGSQVLHFNFPTIVAHQTHVSSLFSDELVNNLTEKGITCLNGYAHFLNENTIAVGTEEYTAANFIIATGAHLKANEISGLDSVNYLTPETAIKVRRLPKAALVVGGGSTGTEIAEYYAELGAKVLIMERADHLLPREDKEAGEALTDYLTNELGVMVLPNSKVVAIEQDEASKRVVFTSGHQEKMVRVDCIVLATGSEPTLDLGLENAGVKYKKSGIIVDKFFQTSTKNIYAIGDCLGKDSSTELAEYEANLLATNILKKSKNLVNYNGFIRITNTYPAIATVGLNEYDCIARDRKFKKSIAYLDELPASKITHLKQGFVKILADSSNHILGATIVAPNAELIAEEISIAIRHRLTALELASTPHMKNSWNFAVKLAAKNLVK